MMQVANTATSLDQIISSFPVSVLNGDWDISDQFWLTVEFNYATDNKKIYSKNRPLNQLIDSNKLYRFLLDMQYNLKGWNGSGSVEKYSDKLLD